MNEQRQAPRYLPGAVDALGLPPQFHSEPRYLGYRDEDRRKPYAHFFAPHSAPAQAHAIAALGNGPVPLRDLVALTDVAEAMSRPGYLALETGFGVTADGDVCVACLTDMPGVAPCMWQWWFGWHIEESARYKLWHPDAHMFTAPGAQRSDDSRYIGSQKYIGNVSYIDEYIGARLMHLAVRFVAPAVLGFEQSESGADPDEVTIVARGGPSVAPVTAAWLIHQVRRTATGSQMRSRFYIGPPTPLPARDARAPEPPAGSPGDAPPEPEARDLLHHCATEMNHLARFLPALYREFR